MFDNLERLFDEAHAARQAVVIERKKVLDWVEEQLKRPSQNPGGADRLRIDLGIRELQLSMLKDDFEESYARYEREQIRSNARSDRRITRLLTVVAIGSCVAAGVQAWCAFFPRAQPPLPCAQDHK